MPDWPAMMKRNTLAAYLDMSEAAVEREVASGRLPIPVKFGGRDHWNRTAVDEALARLNAPADVPDYRQKLRQRYAQKAA